MKRISLETSPLIDLPGRQRWNFLEQNDPDVTVCLVRIAAGDFVRPPHQHQGRHEFIYIIAGNGFAQIENETIPIHSGVGLLVEAGETHALHNPSSVVMQAICFFFPPGA